MAHKPALVVGIGASAGGISALKEFFSRVPPKNDSAWVVILHLSPDHESRLAEVLQAVTAMPVAQVTGRVPVEADRVYVIPPNHSLDIRDDHLTIAEMSRIEQRRAPVDVFFRALGDAYGPRAVCVSLSGTGADGSAGLKRVKEHGGLVMAQDPAEAEFADMPRNAIATRLVDVVAPIAEMPARIAAYQRRAAGRSAEDAPEPAIAVDADAMRDVLTLLRVRTGHDFTNYKPATLHRRVERRIQLRGLTSMAGYARAMHEHPDEAATLMRELLITVTSFFRDPGAWEVLERRVIPALFLDTADGHVRVWVAGCATGEEAYSLAMLLEEHAAAAVDRPAVQIFATDLDERAIAVAREGFYTNSEVVDLSEERLHRFFERRPAGGYRVRRELREKVLFAHHNLIKDPPFARLDLISCRNLLIYLNRPVQEHVVERFHFSLRPSRYLFLGTSETPDGGSDLFMPVDKGAHIYERRSVTRRAVLPIGDIAEPAPLPAHGDAPPIDRIAPPELHQRLLEQYAPPSVVVTDEHNIVHVSARAPRFLQMAAGEPSRDLLRLVRPELSHELRTALYQAARMGVPVTVRRLRVHLEEGETAVTLRVRPVLHSTDPPRGFFLVLFDESPVEPDDRPADSAAAASPPEPPAAELDRVKGQLHATIEHYETQAGHAHAANEELQALNEELRSAAEELATSKEELQSLNEELTTVNQELSIKIEELGITNNDFQNLIDSSDIGTIFLDRELRVKLSTPVARRIFNLLPTDIGRPLSDITSQLLYDEMHQDVRDVLTRLQTIERMVQTRDGRWHQVRTRPYRTLDDRIDGVVITFQDVTERQRAQKLVQDSEERLRLVVDSALDYAIFTTRNDGTIDSWNPGAQRMFGYAADDIVGQPIAVLFTPEDRAAGVPEAELSRALRDGRAPDERYHIRKNGERFFVSGMTTRLTDGSGFAKIARDLTRQRQVATAHDEVTTLLRKLVTSQEEERARIARDLHDQLGQRLTALRLNLERGVPGDRALELLRTIDAELEFLAWEIRPALLDDLGLDAALPRFVREWSEHYGIHAEYRSSSYGPGQLTSEAEVAFYRVAQEALTNVVKHAHASRVDVMLESRDGSVVLVVEDDGVGFDQGGLTGASRGIGLLGMKERAALVGATLQIESAPGKGTSVFLRCPARVA